MSDIRVQPLDQGVFNVVVRDDGDTFAYAVGVPLSFLEQFEGVTGEQLVRESFRFLLERQGPREVPRTFELPVIARTYEEYRSEMRRRLRQPPETDNVREV